MIKLGSVINRAYLSGQVVAMNATGIVGDIDDLAGVVEKVAADLSAAIGAQPPPTQDPAQMLAMQAMQAGQDPAQENPGVGMGGEADPGEVAEVGQSGLTDKDIESAAKVVQVLAEMKHQADSAALGLQKGQGAPAPGQPPMPAPPQAPQGAAPH